MMRPGVPIITLPGVGPQLATRLGRLGVTTIADLLEHYPRRYEDWTDSRSISSLRIGETVVIRAEVVWTKVERSSRRRLALAKALLRDTSGDLLALWFGQGYLANTLRVGSTYYFRGSVGFDRSAGLKQLVSPAFEAAPAILAVYPETAGLSSKQLRGLVRRALVQGEPEETLPAQTLAAYQLVPRAAALRAIHCPPDFVRLGQARRRLAFEELFFFALQMQVTKRELNQVTAPTFALGDTELRAFTAALPFQLTDAQRRAAWEIILDLRRGRPMNRLVEGDVGSGKTVVAAFAAYVAARAGYQTIWMAPTELLASQHYQALTAILQPLGIDVAIWTGTQKVGQLTDDRQVQPPVIVGTQALLSDKLQLVRLGLVIVDEQHRFGVDQRAKLKRPRQEGTPHFLSMTATPIPRTLALALYGDLDLSIIDQRPASRQPIGTTVLQPDQRAQSYAVFRHEIAAGRQGFIVCPLIEEPAVAKDGAATLFADLEQKTAVAEYQRLAKDVFPDLRMGLVHGRLKPQDKRVVMEQFRAHALDILVSTAVIEVGIDVPNATVMLIEGADRFGLAQLHQLRGRVGRGDHPGQCFLVPASWSPAIEIRLQKMAETDDGFRLAEADLELRGPGTFIGTHQSGFPDFALADLMDMELIRSARAAAQAVLTDETLADYCAAANQIVAAGQHLE